MPGEIDAYWNGAVLNNTVTTFGFITDTHAINANSANYQNPAVTEGKADARIKKAFEILQQNAAVQFVVGAGDQAEGTAGLLQYITDEVNKYNALKSAANYTKPTYETIGNHGMRAINSSNSNPVKGSSAELVALLGMPASYYYYEYGNTRFIHLNSYQEPIGHFENNTFGQTQLQWFADKVHNTDKNVVVISHEPPFTLAPSAWCVMQNLNPLSGMSWAHTKYEQINTNDVLTSSGITEQRRIFDILSKKNNVILWLSGHNHAHAQEKIGDLKCVFLSGASVCGANWTHDMVFTSDLNGDLRYINQPAFYIISIENIGGITIQKINLT